MQTNWLKQTTDKPLFPEILWSRPENRRLAGKLLVIGGNQHSFKSPADAYAAALKAGIGHARVVLPDKLYKNVGKLFPEASFAPSTPSGSFARLALAELMDSAAWADGVLLAGDFGKNSETAILLELFLQKYPGQVTLLGDSLDYFEKDWQELLGRWGTLLAPSFGQLQKMAAGQGILIKHSIELAQLVEVVGELSTQISAQILAIHAKQAMVASNGQVSTTSSDKSLLELAVSGAVFWLQNSAKPFESVTSSIL